MDPYDTKIEENKKLINSKIENISLPNLRRTTKILIFENLAKLAKEKFLVKNLNDEFTVNLEEIANTKFVFIHDVSEKIEENLNEIFKDAKEKYIRKAKSIISNLRVNNELFFALFEKKITPEEITKMDEKVKSI